MSNMSYCRFQNTYTDLKDCYENLTNLNPNDDSYNNKCELQARKNLIECCADILQEIGIDIYDDIDVDLEESIAKLNDMYEGDSDE